MAQHADRGRDALLDAAERLFATYGIDAVSNRRIAEAAGNANHSAVTYHFGGRDELIAALLERGSAAMLARREELAARLGPDATAAQLIATRVLPWIDYLESLPRPSWRARFMLQVRAVPTAAESMRGVAERFAAVDDSLLRDRTEVRGIPAEVLRRRSALLAGLILNVCAEVEAQMEAGESEGSWTQVGYFLIDAAAGLLTAPVTERGALTPEGA